MTPRRPPRPAAQARSGSTENYHAPLAWAMNCSLPPPTATGSSTDFAIANQVAIQDPLPDRL